MFFADQLIIHERKIDFSKFKPCKYQFEAAVFNQVGLLYCTLSLYRLTIQFTCEYNSLSLKIYMLVNNDYVVVSSQAQMTATVILLPGVLGECLAVLIVL